MSSAPLHCASDDARRAAIRGADLNGIDSIEVDCAQTTLIVTFLGRAPEWIGPENIRIEGGRRERDIKVLAVAVERAEDEGLDDRMFVTVDRPGDFSTYRLAIVARDERGRALPGAPGDFDVRYASAEFSFKAGCAQDQDPADCPPCPPAAVPPVTIDYLARDYQGFRRLILDRLALTMPDWKERHLPDLGITLVELLAYAADDLSYYQDAVATEGFLDSARLRQSVRRHCRLVDYRLHQGASARTWAAFELNGAETIEIAPDDVMLTTALPGEHDPMVRAEDIAEIGWSDYLVFEPLADQPALTFRRARNRIAFYDWDGSECCLVKGATSATLVDPTEAPGAPPDDRPERQDPETPRPDQPARPEPPKAGRAGRAAQATQAPAAAEQRERDENDETAGLGLAPGDVLLFVEVIGPRTGQAGDADPTRRHAVRLTAVEQGTDPLTGQRIVHVQWCPEDALPFPFCLSARGEAPNCEWLSGISIAFGNVVAVGHGRSVEQALPPVAVTRVEADCDDRCTPSETRYVARPYRPKLEWPDLTFVAPAASDEQLCGSCGGAAASTAARPDPVAALPAIRLASVPPADEEAPGLQAELRAVRHSGARAAARSASLWRPRPDLLDSGPRSTHFVVEMAEDRIATLRFGDGVSGLAPAAGERFFAYYRIGNGPIGNVGADALRHIVFRNAFPDGVTLTVTNPLPAQGGTAREPIADGKLRAPQLFRTRLERAVAAEDYAAIAMRDLPTLVQRAAATLRATGVRREVQVAIDSFGTSDPPQSLLDCIAAHLELYRRIGHDLRVVPARKVPIDLALRICVAPGHIGEQVLTELREALGPRLDRRSRPAFFHPDSLSFGEGVTVSRIVAAAHAVPGVAHVEVTRLERLFEGPDGELEAGILPLGPLELARLDQDRDAPENGRLSLTMEIGQ
ncbi:putative baseplate assembly protein [Sphingomonas parva]|uniref:Putative baseplate assembly protein n=1 Tax=Sphingomonas parva TaxID=2555898 RepID=A0A4Y8ZQ28_9SPHN|nr:putative baseplate assembly protein [Sphingomonas parva]TFI56939.1 putative baseplate assembly protein [Sphingomonas parva]